MSKKLFSRCILALFSFLIACSFADRMPDIPERALGATEEAGVKSWYLQKTVSPRSLKNLYRVKQSSPKTTYRYAAVFEAPDSFRLEMFPDTGFYSLGLFVVEDGKTVFIDQNEKKALIGSDTREFFEEVFGLPITGGDLSSILIGQLPARLLSDPAFSWYRLPDGNLAVADDDISEYWELSASSGLLQRVQIRDSTWDRLLVEIKYLQYQDVDDLTLPGACTLDIPLADVVLELTRLQGSVNKPVAPHLFSPEVPSSYIIEQR